MIERLYQSISCLKRQMYDWGIFDQIELSKPVISVGNLTFGGAGKTPMVSWLADLAVQKNIQAGIISKNYKGKIKDIALVESNRKNGAAYFGDEPFYLAQKNAMTPVYVGPQKWQTALWALEHNPHLQMLVVDDGFQHLQLKRDLDVVLIDAVRLTENTLMREDFRALQAADVVCFTKRNLVAKETEYNLKKDSLGLHCAVYEVDYHLNLPFENFDLTPQNVFAFAGVGDASSVRRMLLNHPQVNLVNFVSFRNHHEYTEKNVEKILLEARQNGASQVVTTMKDYVKLQDFKNAAGIKPIELRISFREEPKVFYEFFNSIH